MRWIAWSDGRFDGLDAPVRCALGRCGVVPGPDKREGDGATPLGAWPVRTAFFRADRGPPPAARLPLAPIDAADGWSDDPADPAYNTHVRLPHGFGHERMMRADGLYDRVVALGYNDAPPVSGRGSAIFLHCAREDYAPTEGCVALARADLDRVLAVLAPGDEVEVRDARARLEPASPL